MTPTHALVYTVFALAGTVFAVCGVPVIVGCAVVAWCVIREERKRGE